MQVKLIIMSNHTVNDLKSPEIEVCSKEIVETIFGTFDSASSFQILKQQPKNPENQDSWVIDINRFKN
jgi:hypothetical protein